MPKIVEVLVVSLSEVDRRTVGQQGWRAVTAMHVDPEKIREFEDRDDFYDWLGDPSSAPIATTASALPTIRAAAIERFRFVHRTSHLDWELSVQSNLISSERAPIVGVVSDVRFRRSAKAAERRNHCRAIDALPSEVVATGSQIGFSKFSPRGCASSVTVNNVLPGSRTLRLERRQSAFRHIRRRLAGTPLHPWNDWLWVRRCRRFGILVLVMDSSRRQSGH